MSNEAWPVVWRWYSGVAGLVVLAATLFVFLWPYRADDTPQERVPEVRPLAVYEYERACEDVCAADAAAIREHGRPYRQYRVLRADVAEGACSCFNGVTVWTRIHWRLVDR